MASPSVDILSQLQGSSWRGVGFPALMLGVDGGHSVAVHKRVDRNGWRVENTGRNSYAFHFKAPFVNSIQRSVNETWTSGSLFPTAYTAMLAALEDRSDGVFVHPIYGERTCKVVDYKDTLDPDFRGGPVLVVSLLETVADDQAALTVASNLSIAASAASTLDTAIALLKPTPVTGTPAGGSLTDFIKSLGSIADQADLFKNQILGKVASVVNAMSILSEKYAGTPGFSDNTQRLISALHAVQSSAASKAKPVSVYLVAAPSTAAAVANRVGGTVADLLALNPMLAGSAVIKPNTVVRYYSK